MDRRNFIKTASLAALSASAVARLGAQQKRIAYGGIQIECSTYGGGLSRMEDFTIRRGKDLGTRPGPDHHHPSAQGR